MAAFSAPATSHGMKGLIGDPSRLAMNAATIQDLHRTPFYPRAADLAAASFRSNNSEMLHAKVVNGTLVPTRPRLSPIEALLTLANGSPSDVSYLSDRPGHGANMTSRDAPKSRGRSSRSPRTLGGLPPHPAPWDLPWEVTSPMTPRPPTAGKTMSPPRRIAASHADDAPPKTAPTYPGPAVSASEWVSDDLVPSSRVEAIQTAEWLRQALTDREKTKPKPKAKNDAAKKGGIDSAAISAELGLWNEAFVETVRQVQVHCQERGQLLDAIRMRYINLVDEILREHEAEMERLRKEYEALMKAQQEALTTKAKVSMNFQKASAMGMLDRLKAQQEAEEAAAKGRKTEREAALEMQLEGLKQQMELLRNRLSELEAQLKDLLDKLNAQPTLETVLEKIDKLSSDDQTTLSYLLLRGVDAKGDYRNRYASSALLQSKGVPDASELVRSLLNALGRPDRSAVILALLQGLATPELYALQIGMIRLLASELGTRAVAADIMASVFIEKSPPPLNSTSEDAKPFLTGDGLELARPLKPGLQGDRYLSAIMMLEALGKEPSITAPEFLKALRDKGLPDGLKGGPGLQRGTSRGGGGGGGGGYGVDGSGGGAGGGGAGGGGGGGGYGSDAAGAEAAAAAAAAAASAAARDAAAAAAAGMQGWGGAGGAGGGPRKPGESDEEYNARMIREGGYGPGGIGGAGGGPRKPGESDEEYKARMIREGGYGPGGIGGGGGMDDAELRRLREENAEKQRTIDDLRRQLAEKNARDGAGGSNAFGAEARKRNPGESDDDYNARMKKLDDETAVARKRKPGESDDEYNARMKKLGLEGGGSGGSGKSGAGGGAGSGGGKSGAGGRGGPRKPGESDEEYNARNREGGGGSGGGRKGGRRKLADGTEVDDDDGTGGARGGGGQGDDEEEIEEDGQIDPFTGMMWPDSSGLKAPFGGLTVTTTDMKPMGVHFLYRLATQSFDGKVKADLKCLSSGEKTELLPFFMVKSLAVNGMQGDMAQVYLSEMFRGLARFGHGSARLRNFKAATGLFNKKKNQIIMGSLQLEIFLSTFESIAALMGEEKIMTQVRHDQMYVRWGEINELYLPVGYLLRGLEKVMVHEHDELRKAIWPQMEAWVKENTFATEKECKEAETTAVPPCGRLTSMKAVVLGTKKCFQNGFANLDLFLYELWTRHAGFCNQHASKAAKTFGMYDINGDGKFSQEEFRKMLKTMDPNLENWEIEELWIGCGGASGVVELKTLEDTFFRMTQLHKKATTSAKNTTGTARHAQKAEMAAAVAKEAAEELGVLVTLWNTVRDAPDEEQATIQLLMMGCRWDTVMRLKTNIYRWQKRTNKGSRKK